MLTMGLLAMISTVMMPAITSLAQLRKSVMSYYQDEIGVYQLQIALATGDIDKVNRNSISYHTSNNDCVLHVVNGKLISQPGTIDFIHGIEEADFEVWDDVVYLNYERGEKKFSWPLAYYRP